MIVCVKNETRSRETISWQFSVLEGVDATIKASDASTVMGCPPEVFWLPTNTLELV
jgi:hypothetical protein